MVRLKVTYLKRYTLISLLFQFLMVRLKENWVEPPSWHMTISIPYGAIKRKIFLQGTGGVGKFQFLMVRLKVKAVTLVTLGYTISIPYGAIKRIMINLVK